MQDKIRKYFDRLTLIQRFMLSGLLVMLAGMLVLGVWVSRQIETGVIRRTGAAAALYVDSFISPSLQELGTSNELLPEHVERLRTLLNTTAMGREIVAFKVWDTRGRLLYSTDSSVVGRLYPMTEGMLIARLGTVDSRISLLEDEENAALKDRYDHLLEIYSPVWLNGEDRIIAVAEFYQLPDALDREIARARTQTWLVVGLAIFLIYLLLSGLVRTASRTITRQQVELERRVEQLKDLLAQNQVLHGRVRKAAASVAMLNEGYLKRIGAELHDGPAQVLSLAILKLDALAGRIERHPDQPVGSGTLDELNGMSTALQDSLKEMRGIAGGLSLPQLNDLSLPETVIRVVQSHERATGSQVAVKVGEIPGKAGLPLRITVYRLIQEALNNAFRHAGGKGQSVHIRQEGDELVVEISDQGPGFHPAEAGLREGHLGLSGMMERVESLGGRFKLESEPGHGTAITAHLPLRQIGEEPE